MYPQRQLTHLALHKAALRRRIAARRIQCGEAADHAVQPLEWMDRILALLQRLKPMAPLVAVPLGLLVARALFPRRKILGTLLRWAPFAASAARGFNAAFVGKRR